MLQVMTECPDKFYVSTDSISAKTDDVSFEMRWPSNWPVAKLIEAAEQMQLTRDAVKEFEMWCQLTEAMDYYGDRFDNVIVNAKRTHATFTPDTDETVVLP